MFDTWERRGTRSTRSSRTLIASASAFDNGRCCSTAIFQKKTLFFPGTTLARAPERTRAGSARGGSSMRRGRPMTRRVVTHHVRGSCPGHVAVARGAQRPIDVARFEELLTRRFDGAMIVGGIDARDEILDGRPRVHSGRGGEPWTRRASNMATCVCSCASLRLWLADEAERRWRACFRVLNFLTGIVTLFETIVPGGVAIPGPQARRRASLREVRFGWRHRRSDPRHPRLDQQRTR